MGKIASMLTVLLFFTAIAFGQNRTITGTLTDENGRPLPGASVQIKGTRTGVAADNNGKYRIQAKTGDKLVISGAGIEAKEVTVGSDSNIDISANTQFISTTEVIVTTALGFQAKRDKLATSQSVVQGANIVQSGEPSVLTGLSSKAAGVNIVRSGGDPGASVYIQIRGQNSIQGAAPLFVVDGVPVNNSSSGNGTAGVQQQSRLNDLNPEDIASVDVLKSAAAAALWGSRAANGVVLITTKKGKASGGKVNISLVNTYSSDQVNRYVPLQHNYGQGSNGRFSGTGGDSRSWGDKISTRAGGADLTTGAAYALLPDGTKRFLIPSGTATNPHGGKNSKVIYDHPKELFQNGYYLQSTLSFSGGDDRSTFYASLSNMSQEGTLKAGSDYYKKSGFISAERKFGSVLKLSGSINYANVKSNRVQQGSNISGIFLGGLRTSPDFDNTVYEADYVDAAGAIFPKRQISYRNPIGAKTNSGYDNPLWIMNRIKSTTDVDRLVSSFTSTVNATNWLQLITQAGIDFYTDHRVDNFPVISAGNPGGSLTIQDLTEQQFNASFIAKGTKSFSNNFDLTALAGVSYNNRIFRNIGANVKNFILPDAPFDLANSAGTSRTPFNGETFSRSNSAFASANLEFYNQLFIELTGRVDAFSTTNETPFYPSASLGWQFTKLGAFENNNALSFGKVRLTYGQVGVEPGAYLFDSYYNAATDQESWGPALDASSPIYGGGYTRSTVKGNPGIKPEIKTEYEAGLDLRFWKNRISLSGTYYNNKTKDVIFSTQVPSTTGFTNTLANVAALSNKGFEAELGVTWFKKGDASIKTSGVFAKNENNVDDLNGATSVFLNGFTGVASRLVEGQPYGALWGVDFLRDAKGTLSLNPNGFPQTSGFESVLGDPNPDWTAGITNTFIFKNFSLTVLVDHVQGGDVWNGTRGALYTFGTAAGTGNEVTATTALKNYAGTTIAAGTPFRGAIQDFGAGQVALDEKWYRDLGGGFGPVGSQFIEDGTRTRLREISLGYSITGDGFKNKTKLQSIDFSITGRNLALWTDYTGIDPETNLTGPSRGRGLDYFNNPSTRSVLLTVRINY